MDRALLVFKPKDESKAFNKLIIMFKNYIENTYMFGKPNLDVLMDLLTAGCEYKLSTSNVNDVLLILDDELPRGLTGTFIKQDGFNTIKINKNSFEKNTNVFEPLDTLFHEMDHLLNDSILNCNGRKKGEYLTILKPYTFLTLNNFLMSSTNYNTGITFDDKQIKQLHYILYHLNNNEANACLYAYYDVQKTYKAVCDTITFENKKINKFFERKHNDYIISVDAMQEYRYYLVPAQDKINKKFYELTKKVHVCLIKKIFDSKMTEADYEALQNLYQLEFNSNMEKRLFNIAKKRNDLKTMFIIINHPMFVHNEENLIDTISLAVYKNVDYDTICESLTNIDKDEIVASYKLALENKNELSN